MSSLALIFDSNVLILFNKTNNEIDEYTSKFETKDGIIKKNIKVINDFLKENNLLLDDGKLVVIKDEVKKEVLLKKHIVAFNHLIKSDNMLYKFCEYEVSSNKKSVSEYFINKSRERNLNLYFVRTYLKEARKSKNYYDIVRDMLNVYNSELELYNLPSLDEIYLKHKEDLRKSKVKSKGNIKFVEEDFIEDKKYYINGSCYTSDEFVLFDIEDLENIESSDYRPDGMMKK